MSDEFDRDFADADDAKAEIRAAVNTEYNLLKRWRAAMNPELRGWLDAIGLYMAIMLVFVSIQGFIDRSHRHQFEQDGMSGTQNMRPDVTASKGRP